MTIDYIEVVESNVTKFVEEFVKGVFEDSILNPFDNMELSELIALFKSKFKGDPGVYWFTETQINKDFVEAISKICVERQAWGLIKDNEATLKFNDGHFYMEIKGED